MATTFNVIFLGISAIDIDPTEGNTTSEDMFRLVGTTFGGQNDPLYDQVQTLSPVGNPGPTYDSNNNPDQFSVDGTTYRFDGWGVYNVTITYADGTAVSAVAKIAQTTTGELFLTPDIPGQEANQALFEAKPIQSLTLLSTGPQGTGMTTERLAGNFIEPVDGTAGNDTMTVGYTDADGDAVTDGADLIRAGDGDDNINAGGGDDVIFAGAGNDLIDDWAGNDLVYAGAGNDTANVSTGNDTYYMEDGDDLVNVWDNAGHNTFYGGDGFDTLDFRNWQSTSGANVQLNPDGTGTFSHFNGATTGSFAEFELISGTAFNDVMDASGSAGGVVFAGEAGNDQLFGGAGDDLLMGDGGDDTLSGAGGNDLIYGDDNNDLIYGGAGEDLLYGGNHLDTIYGGDGNDAIYGGDGADELFGGEGDDTIFGDGGRDLMYGGAGNDLMYGGEGNDTLYGDGGDDNAHGNSGDDLIFGGDGQDTLQGGDGNDVIHGDAGHDLIFGGAQDDLLFGGAGNDTLFGGTENDTLFGGEGDDSLRGGAGDDLITTGTGADTVGLETSGGHDIITDFDMTLANGKTVDQLDVSELLNSDGAPVTWRDVTVTDTNGDGTGDAILTFSGGESVTLQGVSPDQVDSKFELAQLGIPCFTAGTPILTPAGLRAVETLAKGDLVLTQDGPAPLIWAGARRLGAADLAAQPGQYPVHFATGAIGNTRPLRLSPQHAVPVAGAAESPVLVRAKHLAEAGWPGVRIARGMRGVRYHHLLLDRHAILTAAGAKVESMYPGRMALAAFAPADRLGIAAAIIAVRGAHGAKVIALDDLSQIYGPRCYPLLTRREAIRICRTGQALWPITDMPRVLRAGSANR